MVLNIKKNKIARFIFFPIILLRRLHIYYKNRRIRNYNQLFANVKGGSVLVELKDISGCFEIDSRSHLLRRILINKSYEPHIVSLIKSNIDKEKDAINVGANVGLFANLLSDLINDNQKVLAVEPTPLAFKYLTKNIERNKNTNKIITFNGICTDKSGEFTLNTIIGKEEYSSLGDSVHFNVIKENIVQIEVDGDTIDHLVQKSNLVPGILLIDVEGAEMQVLRGATGVLKQKRPIIISELDDALLTKQGSTAKQVVEFLNDLGYEVKNAKEDVRIVYPFTGNVIAQFKK